MAREEAFVLDAPLTEHVYLMLRNATFHKTQSLYPPTESTFSMHCGAEAAGLIGAEKRKYRIIR